MALFGNVQSAYVYGSGREYAPSPGFAWTFYTVDGLQSFDPKLLAFFAVAVRPGDVAAVGPEPQAYAVLLAGLGALMVAVRRRPR